MSRNFRVTSLRDGSREIKDIHTHMSNRSEFRQAQYKRRGGGGPGFVRPTNPRRIQHDDDVAMDGGNNAGGSNLNRYRRGNDRGLDEPRWQVVNMRFATQVDKNVVLELLSESLNGRFQPFQIRSFEKSLSFHVNDQRQAAALKNLSNRITLPDGQKVIIRVERSSRPQSKLTPEVITKIKEVMSKRYDAATFSLDLSNFCEDSDFVQNDVMLNMNQPKLVDVIINTIAEHIPELKSLNLSSNGLINLINFTSLAAKASRLISLNLTKNKIRSSKDLYPIKKLKLQEIWLEGNIMLRQFKDGADYERYMSKYFPSLLKLDTKVLPEPVKFNIDNTELPRSQGSHFGPDSIRGVICLFLQQYFTFYDTKDRSNLVNAYHVNASYSLSCGALGQKRDGFGPYSQFDRNMTKKHHDARYAKLHSPREAVIEVLKKLPETIHDMDSLMVDVLHVNPTLVVFIVKGIFKEVSSSQSKKPIVKQFNRTIAAVPHFEGIAIINEMVTVTHLSLELYNKYLDAQKAKPAEQQQPPVVSPEQVLTPQQQNEMVAMFSQQSGMNPHFSFMCLSDNGWNYETAAAKFTELHARGAIPPEAFVK